MAPGYGGGGGGYANDEPKMECPCGGGPCTVLTARTEKNNGRRFFKCPLGKETGCPHFKWVDEVSRLDSTRLDLT